MGVTTSSSSSSSQSHSVANSQSTGHSQSTSTKILNERLLSRILAGLTGQMTQQEIEAYAQNLLAPQLNAALEEAQSNYETTRLEKEQEIENLAVSLAGAIAQQRSAYGQSMANVENAALSRGMGRSSYTVQSLANQGKALAESIRSLTDENARQRSQIQRQIAQASQQNTRTQGRLRTDYAANLAAKTQELLDRQRQAYNQNYMTAVSGSLGQATSSTQHTAGTNVSTTNSGSHSSSVSVRS